jgi:STE24 endopeptidase
MLYYSVLLILILSFVLERWLDYLNLARWSSILPVELSGIYSEQKYQKSLEYENAKHKFTTISESVSFTSVLLLFLTGGFGWLDGVVRSWVSNPIYIALLYFATLWLVTEFFSLPFKWIDTFVIEEKFGFNKTTRRLFFLDEIKGLILGAVIGGIVIYMIVWIYLIAGTLFWLYALMVITLFSVFMLLFFSTIIVPLFNKQTPLAEGELKNAITEFSNRAGFLLENIYVIDGSKRSTKANAYFTGLGSRKRIVLYDTLISEMNTEEIVAVLAHEIGHYKKHHVYSGLLFSLISTAIMLYVFSLVSGNISFAKVLGSDVPGFHLAVISFGILYSPLSILIGLGLNYLSRKNEYEADRFACEKFNGDFLASALKKLSVNNLSNLTPHPVYVFFHYSHPTLLKRLKNISGIQKSIKSSC